MVALIVHFPHFDSLKWCFGPIQPPQQSKKYLRVGVGGDKHSTIAHNPHRSPAKNAKPLV
ncbi:hypothetical protein GCM10009621_12270 [Corynebacterium felinum]